MNTGMHTSGFKYVDLSGASLASICGRFWKLYYFGNFEIICSNTKILLVTSFGLGKIVGTATFAQQIIYEDLPPPPLPNVVLPGLIAAKIVGGGGRNMPPRWVGNYQTLFRECAHIAFSIASTRQATHDLQSALARGGGGLDNPQVFRG